MSTQGSVMDKPKPNGDLWTIVLYGLLMLMALALIGLGIYLAAQDGAYEVLALGVVALVVPCSIYPLLSVRGSAAGGGAPSELLLSEISERLLLTDQAKRIVYRQKDRELLRNAIQEDIAAGDYDAALKLVDEMSDSFGYHEESEQFREQILDAQKRKHEQLIIEAIERIEQTCAAYKWDEARRMIRRLQRLYPDHTRVASLTGYLDQAVSDRKRELERQFLRAAEVDDVEKAMELLLELDKYLTPAEAEPYRETARGVIGKKRQNLGVRFKMAVHDREWIEAVTVGENIIREFPNSMMANEVRDMLDLLRERAAGQRAAEQTGA